MALSAHGIEISLANDSDLEKETRETLIGLLGSYPLEKWRYTEKVRIESRAIPHSHPVLTLNTQYGPDQTANILSEYIHEQLHWFSLLEQHQGRSGQAINVFKKEYPGLPIGFPEGCRDEFSNYLHVLINYLEWLGLEELIGVEAARALIEEKPYYRAIYRLVIVERPAIHQVLEDLRLIPPPLPPQDKKFSRGGA